MHIDIVPPRSVVYAVCVARLESGPAAAGERGAFLQREHHGVAAVGANAGHAAHLHTWRSLLVELRWELNILSLFQAPHIFPVRAKERQT